MIFSIPKVKTKYNWTIRCDDELVDILVKIFVYFKQQNESYRIGGRTMYLRDFFQCVFKCVNVFLCVHFKIRLYHLETALFALRITINQL